MRSSSPHRRRGPQMCTSTPGVEERREEPEALRGGRGAGASANVESARCRSASRSRRAADARAGVEDERVPSSQHAPRRTTCSRRSACSAGRASAATRGSPRSGRALSVPASRSQNITTTTHELASAGEERERGRLDPGASAVEPRIQSVAVHRPPLAECDSRRQVVDRGRGVARASRLRRAAATRRRGSRRTPRTRAPATASAGSLKKTTCPRASTRSTGVVEIRRQLARDDQDDVLLLWPAHRAQTKRSSAPRKS